MFLHVVLQNLGPMGLHAQVVTQANPAGAGWLGVVVHVGIVDADVLAIDVKTIELADELLRCPGHAVTAAARRAPALRCRS